MTTDPYPAVSDADKRRMYDAGRTFGLDIAGHFSQTGKKPKKGTRAMQVGWARWSSMALGLPECPATWDSWVKGYLDGWEEVFKP